MSNSLRFTRRGTGTFWRPNVILFAGICASTYAHYLKIPWLKLELENHSQKIEKCNVLSMRLVIRKRNEEKSNPCRSNWKVNDCLKWLSMKQNNIWHRPTLTLIGRRGLNYGKEVVNSTDIWTGEIRSPSSSSTKEEWSLTSWHNIKKVASGWNRRRGPLKMDQDNLQKSCNSKLPDRF